MLEETNKERDKQANSGKKEKKKNLVGRDSLDRTAVKDIGVEEFLIGAALRDLTELQRIISSVICPNVVKLISINHVCCC